MVASRARGESVVKGFGKGRLVEVADTSHGLDRGGVPLEDMLATLTHFKSNSQTPVNVNRGVDF